MLQILVYDDDPLFLQRMTTLLNDALQRREIKAMIHTFMRKEEISDNILSGFDIAFLDIDISDSSYNGIDTARALRSLRPDAVIIFVTNFIEYAPEGYEVQAFRYILKSCVDQKLGPYLEQAIHHFRSYRKRIKIRTDGEIVDLFVDAILYIESQLHMVRITLVEDGHLTNYKCYATISSLEEQLEPLGFLRVHRSFLVNMRFIQKYQSSGLILTNGTALPVSERSYAKQKKKFLLWKGTQ